MVQLDRPLFDADIREEFLRSLSDERQLEGEQALGQAQMGLVEAWVIDAWKAVRKVAPELDGFVSEHDTNSVTDMDTGEVRAESEIGLGYL
ncbi:MAG: hypothetical protein ACXVEF_42640 [Polyangiales bacterium]